MSKKALIVVSFGTTYEGAIQAIIHIEETCRQAYPDYDFYRAFTSGMIIRKLKKTKDITVMNPEEVMDRLLAEGYEEVICQPTHIIGGIEYDKLSAILAGYKDKIPVIRIGKPLLSEESDYEAVCRAVMDQAKGYLGEQDALVLMGHGSEHTANYTYFMFADMLRDLGYANTFVATVEGFPRLDYILRRLKRNGIEKVVLMPLLIVAGLHAREDLTGDEEDSWKSVLVRNGFQVESIVAGLGEYDAIASLFADHLRSADRI
ncbi:MAG: sirohydrochlorin cobaltochelatase [Eubacterium sp.]|nr:sirohydrochlorin cobaltochelatase [Eubacterium sp.]